MRVGEIIRKRRKSLRMSQGQLAIYAKVGRPWLSLVEAGKRARPEPDRLRRVAKQLEIPAEELLRAAGYTVDVTEFPPDVVLIAREACEVPESRRAALLPVIQALKASISPEIDNQVAPEPNPSTKIHLQKASKLPTYYTNLHDDGSLMLHYPTIAPAHSY